MEVIGATEDIKRGAIINFVWSEAGMHYISLDHGDGTDFQYILKNTETQSILDFDRSKRVKANVVGDMLYWNDGYTCPHKVNIEKAIKTQLGQEGGYSQIDESIISAIKYAPQAAPQIYFGTNSDIKGNNIRGKSYQFKYRYVYDDHEIGVCSPASKVAISNDVYDFNGDLFSDPYLNNIINVLLYLGESTVTGVQLFIRDGNTADWFLLTHIKKSELPSNSSTYTYVFDNSEAFMGVDQIDVNRQYEYLPDLADTQEFVDGKYMAYGGITEGQALTDVDVNLSIGTTALKTEETQAEAAYISEITAYSYEYTRYVAPNNERNTGVGYFTKIFGISAGLTADQNISISYIIMQNDITTYDGQLIYKTVAADADATILRAHIADMINNSGILFATISSGFSVTTGLVVSGGFTIDPSSEVMGNVPSDEIWVYSKITNDFNSGGWIDLSVTRGTNPSTLLGYIPYPTVKTGAFHRFGIVYLPKSGAKKSTINKGDNCEIYVPTIVDLIQDKTKGNGVTVNIKWQINHQPPLWAYSYQWVYSGPSVEWFVQYIISDQDNQVAGKKAIENSLDGNFTYINLFMLNNLQTPLPDGVAFTNVGSNVIPYEFKKGDRVRILTQQMNLAGASLRFPITNIATSLIDEEIIGYETVTDNDGVETSTERIKVKHFNFESLLLGPGSIIEIYTPKKKIQDDIYYEIGECYSVLNPGTYTRAHQGQSVDQSFDPLTGSELTPAMGVFNKLGAYVIIRKIPYYLSPTNPLSGGLQWNANKDKLFFAESMQYNDYFESYGLDQGNPNVYDPEARRVKLNTIRRSKAYFEGTNTNGLSTFYYDNYITLTSKWGFITGMEMIGGTLKVLLERKQVSIYIGANSLKQAKLSGVDVVVATDNVFGGQNESEDLFGTVAPESVLVVGRHMYFYDQNNSCIVRDAANGPLNISEPFKIRTWLEEIQPILNASDYKRIVSGYSPKYEEVWMSFYAEKAGVITLSSTICFDAKEQSTGFRFVDLNDADGKTADAYCSLSEELFLYREAELYQCDAGNYREFLGVKYPYVVDFISNINPATRKLFNAVAINSNQLWYAKEYGDIRVDSGYQGVQPMSKLFPANFRKVEGVWYAPLNRNARYKTGFYTIDSLYNGEHLRGESLGVKLICESDAGVVLHSVIVKCTVSEKTY